MFEVRTDLAVEENERITKAQEETKGISVTEEDYGEEQIHITTVRITTENGAKQMGKPKGTYITLEAAEMIEDDEDYHREISKRLAEILKELIPVCDKQKNYKESTENQKKVSRKGFAQAKHELEGTSILVAGLGNRLVTPDALGPQVADNLYITRHIIKEFGRRAYENEQVQPVSAIVPGVMAQTGMESQEIITGIYPRSKTGLSDCGGCAGCPQCPPSGPDDPDYRYRNLSGFRCGKSPLQYYKRNHRDSGHRYRYSDRSRSGDDRL